MSKLNNRIGRANCPNCGVIDIISADDVIVSIGRGLSYPIASIKCSKCKNIFMANVEWKSAWAFDELGCKIIGFSRRTAAPISNTDIENFVNTFDAQLAEFLDIIDSENF